MREVKAGGGGRIGLVAGDRRAGLSPLWADGGGDQDGGGRRAEMSARIEAS